jgi:hypothetical protein
MSSYDPNNNKSGRTASGFSGAKDSGEVRRQKEASNKYGSQNYPIKEEDESVEDSV